MTNTAITHFFKLAKNASMFSDFPRQHIGAILVYKNRVIAVGWNTTKENPIQKKYNQYRGFDTDVCVNSLHAEMMCLIKARKLNIEWSKASLFIYRSFKNGKNAIARPCEACMQAIKDYGIKNIYYTSENSNWIYERVNE